MTEVYATNKFYPIGTAKPEVGGRVRTYFNLLDRWENGTIIHVDAETFIVKWDEHESPILQEKNKISHIHPLTTE